MSLTLFVVSLKSLDFNNKNFPGFGTLSSGTNGKTTYSSNNENNINQNQNQPGLDGINAQLIQQLRFMTDSLVSTLQKVAKDPKNGPMIDNVFGLINNVCIGSMEETIELIKQGTNAAEMALLDSTKLLDDVIEGNVKLDREGLEAAREAVKEAFSNLSSKSQKKKY